MSYDEHLISMAGGDGEPLEAIERRIADCQTYNFGMRNADKLAHEGAPALLAIVREQQARIERVEALAAAWEARGESDMAFSRTLADENISIDLLGHGAQMVENARHIRAALEPKP